MSQHISLSVCDFFSTNVDDLMWLLATEVFARIHMTSLACTYIWYMHAIGCNCFTMVFFTFISYLHVFIRTNGTFSLSICLCMYILNYVYIHLKKLKHPQKFSINKNLLIVLYIFCHIAMHVCTHRSKCNKYLTSCSIYCSSVWTHEIAIKLTWWCYRFTYLCQLMLESKHPVTNRIPAIVSEHAVRYQVQVPL